MESDPIWRYCIVHGGHLVANELQVIVAWDPEWNHLPLILQDLMWPATSSNGNQDVTFIPNTNPTSVITTMVHKIN
jgi:hypothetical protein